MKKLDPYNAKIFIGQQIKKHRINELLTLQQLADKLNVDRHYVWKLENGKINLTIDYLDKIIKILKCQPKDFFKE